MSKSKEWILEWFGNNATVGRETLEENMDVNYIEAGYIDSFVFISLIGDIEDEFGIVFDNEQFVENSFATISGLIKILDEMAE